MFDSTTSGRRAHGLAAFALAALVLAAVEIAAPAQAVGAVARYTFSPSPIAAQASLPANAHVTVTLTAKDSSGTAVPGATVYLSFYQAAGGGSASVGGTPLGSKEAPFVTDSSGHIAISYATPATLPTGGKDNIVAKNATSSATVKATDSYCYSVVFSYTFSPRPIAAPGTLSANTTVTDTVTALNSSKVAVPGAVIYLTFTPTSGGGTASVGATALSATPAPFTANSSGQVLVTYKTPATLPVTGIDVITAQDSAVNPCVQNKVRYDFGKPARYAFTPLPIASTGSLGASKSVNVTLTVYDSSNNPVADAKVYFTFFPTSGGGTATIGTTTLSSTPSDFRSGPAGQVTIVYKTPSTVPSSGTDTLTAANAKTSPTITASDSYTY